MCTALLWSTLVLMVVDEAGRLLGLSVSAELNRAVLILRRLLFDSPFAVPTLWAITALSWVRPEMESAMAFLLRILSLESIQLAS